MTSESRWKPDGWHARARIGIVVPHADVGPEAEVRAVLPSTVSVHGARLYFSAMRAGGLMDPTIPHQPVESFTAPPLLDDTVESLAASPLDAIALGFTSSAYKHGPEGEHALLERLKEPARGIPIVTTCLAAENALRALDARTLALVNPPWFDDDLDTLGARYFRDLGFDVVHHAPAGLRSGQEFVTPDALHGWIVSIAKGADAVFVAGNGQRAVGVIDALEHDLGIPILTANQVLAWNALEVVGEGAPVTDYGALFGRRLRQA
ncbi:maleate cis-trans isomerase [Nocardia sp. NPDC059239]|uniref:maleate cis-trans isomerase family protein n=1 Tax=Nocardia sp. NPDC059239 TaxID=3346785 RepID=UPI0036C6468A